MKCLLENSEFYDTNTEIIEKDDCWWYCFCSIRVEKMTHNAGIITVSCKVFTFQEHYRCKLIDSDYQKIYKQTKDISQFADGTG